MKTPLIALAGNPNCGKSTLFNALTGKRQHVGNWPGVTVERTTGSFCHDNQEFSLIDLPGTYSLSLETTEQAIDERIACETILDGDIDVVVNVLDAANLERQLYLTAQLVEMNVPVVVVVNKLDVLLKNNIPLDLNALAERIGVPVVGVIANRSEGLAPLMQTLLAAVATKPLPTPVVSYDEQIITQLSPEINQWRALHLLESTIEDADITIADARFSWATRTANAVLKNTATVNDTKNKWDAVLLHRFWGIPIFLGIMYLIFLCAINIGGLFQNFFDIGSATLFVDGVKHVLRFLHAPHWVVALFADGAGRGINTTLTFVPVIGSMFFLLSFLESSGYMARAAFVVDRAMRVIGLPGKSFVPMIVGFGCNVPGIMATRTLDNRRDRILTIMMSPFMSCGARLAIYAVFTAAFFPVGGQNVVFALYLIGILMAVVTGLILRKTVLKGKPAELVMEMPSYSLPKVMVLARQTWFRLKGFVLRAGRYIVPVCMVLGTLNQIATPGKPDQTLLASMGKVVTPVFSPMGIGPDNWPATVGLLAGVMSKEVVVATLNTLYSQTGKVAEVPVSLSEGLTAAWQTIPSNILALPQTLGNPIKAAAPKSEALTSVYGEMYRQFGGQIPAFAYLLFVLLYFPCISATAAMVRELNKRWAAFSVLWSTGVAYAVAVCFYQIATIPSHPFSSFVWVFSIVTIMTLTIQELKRNAKTEQSEPERGPVC